MPIGQAAQAVVYVPTRFLRRRHARLTAAGHCRRGNASDTRARVARSFRRNRKAPTSVTLFDQGLVQVLEAAVTGLEPTSRTYWRSRASRTAVGVLEPLAAFINPLGSPRSSTRSARSAKSVRSEDGAQRRYLVIVSGTAAQLGPLVQIQAP